MKTKVFSLLASLALLATAVAVAESEVQTVSGSVIATTEGSLVIATEGGGQMAFALDPQATTPESLAAGSRATVTYHQDGTSRLVATAVTLQAPEAAAVTGTPEAGATTPASGSGGGEPSTLPATASLLPLVGLFGLLALVGGVALRLAR